MIVSPDDVQHARRAAARSAAVFRLPFRRDLWRGAAGNWAGAGIGSSIDFQDHRPYVPGDDPRYIDWRAYARSDHYVMKLYREEVSPHVDLVIDLSTSMHEDVVKKRRSLELFYFVVESTITAGAGLRVWVVTGHGATRWDAESVYGGAPVFDGASLSGDREKAGGWISGDREKAGGRISGDREKAGGRISGDREKAGGRISGDRVDHGLLETVELRPGSLRVLVSDCLFPGEPDRVVRALAASKGRAVVLAPATASESEPEWAGQLELEDCETGSKRVESIDAGRLAQYRAAYQRHFQWWEQSCRRRGMPFVQIPSEPPLDEALRVHALGVSAVEPCA